MVLKNNYLLITLSFFLVGLSQQPLHLGFLSWIGLIPLIYVLDNETDYKHIICFSFIWGIGYNLLTVFWLAFNIGASPLIAFISMLAAVLILSTNTILISLIWFKIRKNKIKFSLYLFAFIWVSVEYLRSYGLLGFPWISLANSQIEYFFLIQNAEYTGIYGISFWVILLNLLIYDIAFKKLSKNKILSLIFIFIFPFIIGYFLHQKNNEKYSQDDNWLSFLLVQPNINLFEKRNQLTRNQTLENIIELTHENINDEDLIIWPESAMAFHRMQNKSDRAYLTQKFFKNNRQYLLTGNIFYKDEDVFNSAILLNVHGIKNVYHKRQLVPIAEHVPLSSKFKYLKELNFGQANFSKGPNDVIFNINNYKFSSLICFESTFPEINRRHAKQGLDVLIYLVNDGWYTSAPEPQQHARQSIYRAIENRLPVIRCANTGISMFIHPSGKVEKEISLNKSGTINGRINKNNKAMTFYTRYGNIFALILLLISSFFFLKSIFLYEKK